MLRLDSRPRLTGRAARSLAVLAVLGLLLPSSWAGEEFQVDAVHSVVAFKVRHLVSRVAGNFRDFEGTILIDRDDLAKSSVEFVIASASIDTGNAKRDGHLRAEDFFDTEKYPEISFRSSRMEKVSADTYNVTGRFSMHGVTQVITVPVQVYGFTSHPRFGERAGFSASFALNREDYGILWNMPMDADSLVLGKEVQIQIEIEAVKVKAPETAGTEAAG